MSNNSTGMLRAGWFCTEKTFIEWGRGEPVAVKLSWVQICRARLFGLLRYMQSSYRAGTSRNPTP